MSFLGFFKKGKVDVAAELQKLFKQEIVLESEKAAQKARADQSKIGGKPFLPADFVWPTFKDNEDGVTRPLSFFCQINLAELEGLDTENVLPKQGLLSFFYECESFRWGFDPEDAGAAGVYYFEDTTDFIPFAVPDTLCEEYRMPELALRFDVQPSYPSYEEFSMRSGVECDYKSFDKATKQLGIAEEDDPNRHKLLGYADIIQGEMLTDCERAARGLYSGDPKSFEETSDEEQIEIAEKAKNWTLLLQLGTIEAEDFEWMFGDCGMLYFYIKKEDMAARRFENVWFAVQCG